MAQHADVVSQGERQPNRLLRDGAPPYSGRGREDGEGAEMPRSLLVLVIVNATVLAPFFFVKARWLDLALCIAVASIAAVSLYRTRKP